jgi:hypothetical protein
MYSTDVIVIFEVVQVTALHSSNVIKKRTLTKDTKCAALHCKSHVRNPNLLILQLRDEEVDSQGKKLEHLDH